MNKESVDKLKELEGLAAMVTRLRNADPSMRSEWSRLLYRIWQLESQIGEGCTDSELEDAYRNPVRFGFDIRTEGFQFEPVSVEGEKVRMRLSVNYRVRTLRYPQ